MATGTTNIDFGAFPGASDASVAVTGQAGILAGSLVEAWLRPVDTADHLADEHWVDGPKVVAGNIVAGLGFTIYGTAPASVPVTDQQIGRGRLSPDNNHPRCYGLWTVAWVWN